MMRLDVGAVVALVAGVLFAGLGLKVWTLSSALDAERAAVASLNGEVADCRAVSRVQAAETARIVEEASRAAERARAAIQGARKAALPATLESDRLAAKIAAGSAGLSCEDADRVVLDGLR